MRGWTDGMTIYAHIMSPPEQYARPSPREHIIPTTSESCHAWESVGRSSESVRDWFIYLNFRLYEVEHLFIERVELCRPVQIEDTHYTAGFERDWGGVCCSGGHHVGGYDARSLCCASGHACDERRAQHRNGRAGVIKRV